MTDFTEEQIQRYSRQIILKDVGVEGQQKIMEGKVLIVGSGGLGSPIALYLAAAGVGTIGLIDADNVDLTNLQRQIIHSTEDIGKPKVISAKETIEKINPNVKVITYFHLLDSNNIIDIINKYDFIIDGTDNFEAKYLINDACVLSKKPFSHGGVVKFNGQTLTYTPNNACFRCVFSEIPEKDSVPTCAQAGILGSIAGILGSIQATEALKFLIGKGELLTNKIFVFDSFNNDYYTVNISKDKECEICGENATIKKPIPIVQDKCDLK